MFVLIQRHKRRHSKSATSSCPDKINMLWERKRLLGHFEKNQLILGVTDKSKEECKIRNRYNQVPQAYPGHHIGMWPKHKKTSHENIQESQEVKPSCELNIVKPWQQQDLRHKFSH